MKHILLFLILGIGFLSGCSTAFRQGQTPDDIYYSPSRELAVTTTAASKSDQDEYQNYISSQDDQYLHMKVANRSLWSSLDNTDYWYDSRYDFTSYNYAYYNNYAYYDAINPYNAWGPCWNLGIGYNYFGWNSPVYTVIAHSLPASTIGFGPVFGSNIKAYKNKVYSNTNYAYKDPKTGVFVSNGNNFGTLIRRVFSSGTGNSASPYYDRPARTFSNSSSNATYSAPSGNAGGYSGGFRSSGSTAGGGRGGRG